MIEETVLNYLNECFQQDGIQAFMEAPDAKNPGKVGRQFIVVEKTGSSMENWIFQSTMAIQSYGETLYEAAALNERVKEAMFGILSCDEVTKVTLNSDYNFTNPSTKQPRYQAVFELTHYFKNE